MCWIHSLCGLNYRYWKLMRIFSKTNILWFFLKKYLNVSTLTTLLHLEMGWFCSRSKTTVQFESNTLQIKPLLERLLHILWSFTHSLRPPVWSASTGVKVQPAKARLSRRWVRYDCPFLDLLWSLCSDEILCNRAQTHGYLTLTNTN